jgi:hypothetical protein
MARGAWDRRAAAVDGMASVTVRVRAGLAVSSCMPFAESGPADDPVRSFPARRLL